MISGFCNKSGRKTVANLFSADTLFKMTWFQTRKAIQISISGIERGKNIS